MDLLTGKPSEAELETSQTAKVKLAHPRREAQVSMPSNESYHVDDRTSHLAPFPDKLSNFDSTLKAGFGASPRYMGNEEFVSIKVRDELDIQNQVADMSMQELAHKLTEEMKQKANKRQESIRRQLTNFRGESEGGQSQFTAIAESQMGAGAEYFVSPSFGARSPLSTMPHLNSPGSRPTVLPSIDIHQSV
jgi:hypothetical protein